MDIWNVVSVGEAKQTTANKRHANRTWKAVVEIRGSNIDVIFDL